MSYTIERCRSHEVHSTPRSWEPIFAGSESEVVRKWWASYAGVCPSGDQYRVVDSDGAEQLLGSKKVIGPIYPATK